MSDTQRLDARALLVLSSHPLRTQLISQLRSAGPATATALARALDTNTGATSYHLRKLAEVDLVTETGEGKGRERWWRATHSLHEWYPSDLAGQEDGESALALLHAEHMRFFSSHAEHWLGHERHWPAHWRDLAGSSDYRLNISASGLRALQEELYEVFGRHLSAEASSAFKGPTTPEGERPVLVFLHFLPEGDPT